MTPFTKEDIAKFALRLQSASRIVITAHVHPDGDAVGSTTALLSYLTEALHKDACVVLPDECGDSIRFVIPEFLRDRVRFGAAAAEEAVKGCDTIFCLACNGFSRTEGLREAFESSPAFKILVDHHVGPEREAFGLVFSETEVSSTCELLYWLLTGVAGGPADLPKTCAAALMAGMTTDTNNFANSVFPSTFEMASGLLSAGVDRTSILEHLYNNYGENRIRLMGHALQDLLTITPEGAAVIILKDEDKVRYDVREGDTEGFVNIPLAIASVRISLFLKEEEGLFRVSIRSRRDVSARNLATRFFHGGGHEQAAGGKVLIPGDIPSREEIDAYIQSILKGFKG